MLIEIPGVLNTEQVSEFRERLESAPWEDGRHTAGYLSSAVKSNQQLPETHTVARQLGEKILQLLERNSLFLAGALPQRILPPLFNRYVRGHSYGSHIDGSIRQLPGTPLRIRTDISATLFLSEPDEYQGGELIVEDSFGEKRIKLDGGDMALYSANSVHSVAPVADGVRYAAFFWIQSLVRSEFHRRILYDLDASIQSLALKPDTQSDLVRLAGVYHNMLRCWADT